MEMAANKYIIVNADDYGYYDCVSKGILNASNHGAVTATGLFANSPFLEKHLTWLRLCHSLDIGVHLNLTDRTPLTLEMRKQLGRWKGGFPGKFVMAWLILTGRISLELVGRELRAQIERCRSTGIVLRFLNSHEHIHMLPPIFRITQDLAIEYDIPHIRYSSPDAIRSFAPGPLIRDLALNILSKRNDRLLHMPVIPFLGMAVSGKLNQAFLQRTLHDLSPGVYELMCHPGICGSNDSTNPKHRAYHDWKGEFRTLTSNKFHALCHQHNIGLIGYRDIRVVDGNIEAVNEPK